MSVPCQKLVNFYTKTFATINSFSEIPFMERSSSCVRVATLCLDPSNINSVFKTLKASLFAIIPTCIHGYNGVYMGITGYTWV